MAGGEKWRGIHLLLQHAYTRDQVDKAAVHCLDLMATSTCALAHVLVQRWPPESRALALAVRITRTRTSCLWPNAHKLSLFFYRSPSIFCACWRAQSHVNTLHDARLSLRMREGGRERAQKWFRGRELRGAGRGRERRGRERRARERRARERRARELKLRRRPNRF